MDWSVESNKSSNESVKGDEEFTKDDEAIEGDDETGSLVKDELASFLPIVPNEQEDDAQSDESDSSVEIIDYETSLPCVKCDSRRDGNHCFDVKNIDYLDECFSKLGQCYIAIVSGDIVRGCVGDDQYPSEELIQQNEASVEICNDNRLCNEAKILDTCIVCSGEECKAPSIDMKKGCSFGQTEGCYLRRDQTEATDRGCVKDLALDEQEKCHRSRNQDCQVCFERNCNQKLNFNQKCYFCNGTEDIDCHEPVTVKHTTITCIDFSSTCLVGIDADGFFHRQCSTNAEKDEQRFPNGYKLCYDDHCNKKVFPENRHQCYRCDKDIECNHPSINLPGQLCRRHPDECFTFGKNG